MNRDVEKKIYECLGVNVFRKYVLFTWEKIAGLFHLPIGYRMEDLSIDAIKNYKSRTKAFTIAHIIAFFIMIPMCFNPLSWMYNILINFYCIIVQRYNFLRIKEVEEKFEKLQALKMKRQKRLENKDKNTLSLEKVNELINLLSNSSEYPDLVTCETNKTADIKPFRMDSPLDPNYWSNQNQESEKALIRKAS